MVQGRPIGQEVIQSLTDGCDSVIIDIALVFTTPQVEISTTNPACEGLTGQIEINIPETSFAPYTISADEQMLEGVSAFPATIDVMAGDYTVEVSDALGCITTGEAIHQFYTLLYFKYCQFRILLRNTKCFATSATDEA
jgi:hypothetical protein